MKLKLLKEVVADSPINGMRKQKAIRYIQKTFDVYNKLRGFFTDDYWQPINDIIGDFHQGDINLEIHDTEYLKTNGEPSTKIWSCKIPFINQNGRDDIIYCTITAAGAGSIDDPLGRYDVTMVLS